jgi:hypothetical protein
MIHLTLNTGHSMQVPAGKVTPATIRALGPMVVKKGDLIPACAPWRTIITIASGHASFDIRKGRHFHVTFNVLAWTPEGADLAWSTLERQYLKTAEDLAAQGIPLDLEMPEQPTSLPWLATWILPTATHHIHPQEIHWMADFEQCLAATILHKHTHSP